MLPLLPFNRPFDHADLWQQPRSRGGIAPLRHDRALGGYLEKRAAYMASGIHTVGVWDVILRLWTAMTSRGWPASPGSLPGRRVVP